MPFSREAHSSKRASRAKSVCVKFTFAFALHTYLCFFQLLVWHLQVVLCEYLARQTKHNFEQQYSLLATVPSKAASAAELQIVCCYAAVRTSNQVLGIGLELLDCIVQLLVLEHLNRP